MTLNAQPSGEAASRMARVTTTGTVGFFQRRNTLSDAFETAWPIRNDCGRTCRLFVNGLSRQLGQAG